MSICRTTAHFRPIPLRAGFHRTIPLAVRHLHASTTWLATQQDHYDVLGLTQSSSKRDIKNKYYEVSYFSRRVQLSDSMACIIAIHERATSVSCANESPTFTSCRKRVILIEKAEIELHSKR